MEPITNTKVQYRRKQNRPARRLPRDLLKTHQAVSETFYSSSENTDARMDLCLANDRVYSYGDAAYHFLNMH